MIDILLIGMFTAFFLAALEPLISFLSLIVSMLFVNATLSLTLSLCGTLLSGWADWKDLVLKTVGCAFLGSSLLAIVERLAYFRPNNNSVRQ
jgi:O-antigen ligase